MRSLMMIAAAVLVLAVSVPATAQPEVSKSNADALKAEIKQRCQDSMSDYGESMVLQCMKQDWQAVKRIPEYRQSHPNVTQRCLGRMRDYGFAMVLQCIKQDASAQDQIEDW